MNQRTTPAARNETETGRRVATEKKELQTATVDVAATAHRRKFREDDRNRLAQGGDGGAVARVTKNSTSKEQKPGKETGTHQYDLGKQDLLKLKEEIEKTASAVQTRTSSTSSSSYHTAAERHSKSEPPASPGMPQLRMFSWDFGNDFAPVKPTQGGPLGALPIKAQEYRLIKDLLNCMIGCDGISIHSRLDPHGKRVFSVDDTADVSLREIAGRILPLCASYSTVMRFAEDKWEPGQGLVNQALAAALRHLLHDQFTLAAQLEHQLVNRGGLTLQKMWFYVQPALAYMETLASIVRTLRKENCYGGKILGALHKRTVSLTGDAKSRDIGLHLIKAASVPYFDMLERWVYRGHIRDPNAEFMVCDKSQVKKEDMSVDHSDNYWNSRYALRPDMVPKFLRPIQDKILITGKYHNVILQCGAKPKSSPEDRLCYSVDEREYGEKIERSYQLASRTLLDLLMQKVDLMGRLRSVKHFFLMDQGDFVVQFMDMAEEELSKELDDIVPTRLEVLLQLALSTSSVASDRYRDCVKHQVLEWSLLTQVEKIMTSDGAVHGTVCQESITGHEAFTLNYEVNWPLNLVLSTTSLGCYQMVFRYLFYCTHVERMLLKAWVLDKRSKRHGMPYPTRAFGLRQRMVDFVKNLQYFITVEVVEPSWHVFQDKMGRVQTIDEVLQLHTELTDSFMSLCMLSNYPIFKVIYGILGLCLDFTSFIQKQASECEAAKSQLGYIAEDKDSVRPETPFDRKIGEVEESFNTSLSTLKEGIRQGLGGDRSGRGNSLVEMLHRIDFNEFYSTCQSSGSL
ncbi:hypothetical protein HPB47_027311 [Ixodes persulcatus]|uniref:Uncharacterized protein n=1 Tax=Ixodes persulcatus TaxID=34615 RepID=A0AC60PWL6_IXOPE|nr:hypothetical protein HPB47_027311 [Ixodes persulcatus]